MQRLPVLIPFIVLTLACARPALAQSSFSQALREAAMTLLNEALVKPDERVQPQERASTSRHEGINRIGQDTSQHGGTNRIGQSESESSSSPSLTSLAAVGASSTMLPTSLSGMQFECQTPKGASHKRVYLPGGRFYAELTNTSRIFVGRYRAFQFSTVNGNLDPSTKISGYSPGVSSLFDYVDGRWRKIDLNQVPSEFNSDLSWTNRGIILGRNSDNVGYCLTLSDASLLDRATKHEDLLASSLSAKGAAWRAAANANTKVEQQSRDSSFATMMAARSRAANLVSNAERSGCQHTNFLKRVYFGIDNRMVRYQETMASAGAAPMADVLESLAYDYDGVSKQAREACP